MATHRRGLRGSQWQIRDLLGDQRSGPSPLRDPRLYAAVGGLLACGAAATVAFTASDGGTGAGHDAGGPLALPVPRAVVPAPSRSGPTDAGPADGAPSDRSPGAVSGGSAARTTSPQGSDMVPRVWRVPMDDGAAPAPAHAGSGRRTVPVQKVINRSGHRVPWPRAANRAMGRHRADTENASSVTPAPGDAHARGEARHGDDDRHHRQRDCRHRRDDRARHACEHERQAHSHAAEHDADGAARTHGDDHRRDRDRAHGRHDAGDSHGPGRPCPADHRQDKTPPRPAHDAPPNQAAHESTAPEPTSQAAEPQPAMAALVASARHDRGHTLAAHHMDSASVLAALDDLQHTDRDHR
jgi:hypothetical protein